MFKKGNIESYLKDSGIYDLNFEDLYKLHNTTSKDELVRMICELIDRYNYLLKHKKPMSFYNLTEN